MLTSIFLCVRWGSLLILLIGVALSQYKPGGSDGGGGTADLVLLGLAATLLAAVLSGFSGQSACTPIHPAMLCYIFYAMLCYAMLCYAMLCPVPTVCGHSCAYRSYIIPGVYMESILKGVDTTLWERNVQMGFSSIPLAFLALFFSKVSANPASPLSHGLP
jgi:hypothetical protein